MLDDLADKQSQLDSEQLKKLSILTQGCREVLEDLDSVLRKNGSLNRQLSGLGSKTRKAWKGIKWDQKDIEELRSRIVSNISLLNLFNSSLARLVPNLLRFWLQRFVL